MLEGIVETVKEAIGTLGYPGILVVVALENVFPLIPSEVVLPFTGFLSSEGRFQFWIVLLVATAGALIGACIPYFVGRWLGEDRVRAFLLEKGRYLALSAEHLERADRWFADYGRPTVFFGRMVPGVRAAISVPAGFARQPFGEFVLYTTLGNLVWNTLLIGAGHVLGRNWDRVEVVMRPVSYAVYALLAVAVLFIGYRLFRRRVGSGAP